MERAAGLQRDDTSPAKLDKLDALLAQTSTSKEDVALLAEMLSLPNDGRYPTLDLTAQQRRQRTLEALTGQLGRLASQHPVLMIFEDVHWIDPTSLEALKRSVDQIKALSALLIVTFRPEFIAPWVGQSQVTSITLNRLGERDAAAIVASLAGNKELPADVLAEIVERTDGIPLFVEEMTKAVLEAESESDARKTTAAVPSSSAAVPASLHASLMARLDRLGPAKEVAQIGAVIGREFSHALLAAVVSEPEADLRSTLERLTAAGLLFRQGVPPHATYLFKHALIQDAAYGTLLRGPRRALHARIAETLENQFPDIAENQPELAGAALHRGWTDRESCRAVGQSGTAVSGAVGPRRGGRTTHARSCPNRRPCPPHRRCAAKQLSYKWHLRPSFFMSRATQRRETIAAFERADAMIEQAEALGERPRRGRATSLFGAVWPVDGQFYCGKSRERAARNSKAFPCGSGKATAICTVANGSPCDGSELCLILGELQAAQVASGSSSCSLRAREHRSLATRFGQDIGVAALTYRAFVLYTA